MRVRGTRAIKRLLQDFGDRGKTIVSSIAEATAQEGVTLAKQKLQASPVDYSKIAQSISANKLGEYSWEISVNELPMGAYVEFGTGTFVDVPTGWEETAMQFYVNGKGYLHPFPYLIPQYYVLKRTFSEDIDSAYSRLCNEFNRR